MDTAKFLTLIEKSQNCWTWKAGKTEAGYGHLRQKMKQFLAHRYMWEITYGEIPKGMCVLHHCDNPGCVRPQHLFLGTKGDNARDMASKGRGRFYKLPLTLVINLWKQHLSGISQRELGRRYKVDHGSISRAFVKFNVRVLTSDTIPVQ